MKIEKHDKFNLRDAHKRGKLFNESGNITVSSVTKAAKQLPFLAKYFDNPTQSLDDLTASYIIASIADDEGRRIYYAKPDFRGEYETFDERFGTREQYNKNEFYAGLEKALRFSPDAETTEAIHELIKLKY